MGVVVVIAPVAVLSCEAAVLCDSVFVLAEVPLKGEVTGVVVFVVVTADEVLRLEPVPVVVPVVGDDELAGFLVVVDGDDDGVLCGVELDD